MLGCHKPAEVEVSPRVETLLVQSEIGGFVSGERVKAETDPAERASLSHYLPIIYMLISAPQRWGA